MNQKPEATPKGIIDLIAKIDPKILLADGFDDCVIGLTFRDEELVALYSADAVIGKLSKDMPCEDAVDYFEFNVKGAYIGEKTPVFFYSHITEF